MSSADRPGRSGGRPTQGPRGGRSADGRRGGDGPPRRPQTRRPPDIDHARQAALDLLAAVRARSAYANLTLPGLLSDRGLSGRDAALATELAYGTCRALGQLDAVIGACCDRPLADLDGPVLDALRLAAYQLLHTRIPDHAAVSVTVDLVRAGSESRGRRFRERRAAQDVPARPGRLDRRDRTESRRRSTGLPSAVHRPSPVDRHGDPGSARRHGRRARAWPSWRRP